jgi:hypothetical protein
VPQYYVQNNHHAIIEPDEFDAVQVEMERRKHLGRRCTCGSMFIFWGTLTFSNAKCYCGCKFNLQ